MREEGDLQSDPMNTERGRGASVCTLQRLVTLRGMLSMPCSSSGLRGCLSGKADSSRRGPGAREGGSVHRTPGG